MKIAKGDLWDPEILDAVPVLPQGLDNVEIHDTDAQAGLEWIENSSKRKSRLNMIWRGAACTCSAGASHVLCLALPVITGGASGGLTGGVLASGAAMYALSPVFAIAINAGIDRWNNVTRDLGAQIRSVAITGVVAIGATAAIGALTGHEHIDSSRRAFMDSLPPERRAEQLVVPQMRYDRLPDELKERVDRAAFENSLSVAEYMYFCDGSDRLGGEIYSYEMALRAQQKEKLTP